MPRRNINSKKASHSALLPIIGSNMKYVAKYIAVDIIIEFRIVLVKLAPTITPSIRNGNAGKVLRYEFCRLMTKGV